MPGMKRSPARWRGACRHGPRRGRSPVVARSVVAPPGDRLVEEGEVVGRFEVVAERLQRPDDDVAMAVPVADVRIGLEHEPLRPVAAASRTAAAKTMRRISLTAASCSSASRNSTGPWQTSRVPQAAPVYCSRPCGTREMDHRVVGEPREERVERRDLRAGAREAQAAGDVAPVARAAGAGMAASSTPPAYLSASRSAARRIGHRADHGEGERRSSGGSGARRRRRRPARPSA